MSNTLFAISLALVVPACVTDPELDTDEVALSTPIVIASGQDTPLGVIVDSTTAYWVNATNLGEGPTDLVSTKKSGGATVEVLVSAIASAGAPSQDALKLYWPAGATTPHEGGLFSRAKAGGAVTTLVPDLRVFSAAPSGSWVYFVSPDDGGFVGRVAKSGGPVTVLANDVGPGLDNIPVIGFAGDRVVFTQSTFGVECDGRVRSVPKTGGTVATHAADLCNLFHLRTDDDAAYWTETDSTAGTGRLRKLELTDGAMPVDLDTVDGQAMFVATDAFAVYYTAALPDGTSAIRRVGKHGHAGATIATDPGLAFSLAIDGAHAYWTSPFTGEVKRVRRW